MTAQAPPPPSAPPDYPYCGRGAAPGGPDPVGCRGRTVDGGACLAHLSDTDRAAYLGGLGPGRDVDHRGTPLSGDRLAELLAALRDPATGLPSAGTAWFQGAVFPDAAGFDGMTFHSDARFDEAAFLGTADFSRVRFGGIAWFSGAVFRANLSFGEARLTGQVSFLGVVFGGETDFGGAVFTDRAMFSGALFRDNATFAAATFDGLDTVFAGVTFTRHARFGNASFAHSASFDRATVRGLASFSGATFAGHIGFGDTRFTREVVMNGARFEVRNLSLACKEGVDLSDAIFSDVVRIDITTARLRCTGTRWSAPALVRVRHAVVDLDGAFLEHPVVLAAHPEPLHTTEEELFGPAAPGGAAVRISSVRGVDAAQLVLTDVDLTACRFSGTIHLDQLRLEGRCVLASTPTGWHRRGLCPVRWTQRRTLAEEHHWRAANRAPRQGWMAAGPGEVVREPVALAPVYRQIRKAFEDGKHEPGASDFYYGEMEMRRHADDIPWGERLLLTLYWAVSGYGLRASRALLWLLGSMAVTVTVMLLWGLPKDSPHPVTEGTVDGRTVRLITDTPDPAAPSGGYAHRLTAQRLDKAVRVVINSVVFRSSEQDLTTVGTYAEMTSRIGEPVLLGFAAWAVRSRVKR
ncbi:pentapeptide repeat-containing protein [Streptomyces sp. NPDC050085]|uniref:pentapeptide repeat-containing protein n=1 Tax=Streptomyces sp. NPDC050085 TaxID=3365600 RepID=UPI0037967C3A